MPDVRPAANDTSSRRSGSWVLVLCGPNLYSSPGLPGTRPVVDRMLWAPREGALLVHAAEAITLTGSEETETLKLPYERLATLARTRDPLAVPRFF